jgi:hypothetical protein
LRFRARAIVAISISIRAGAARGRRLHADSALAA